MNYHVSYVSFDNMPAVIGGAMYHLADAIKLSGGRHDKESVLQDLAAGNNQLWIAYDDFGNIDGALTTSVEEYPGRKMLNILFCGGENLEDWHSQMLDLLYSSAKDNGCNGIELVGRKGWERFLSKHGWQTQNIFCQIMFPETEEKRNAA